MAPYISSPPASVSETRQKLYILSEFHPAAIKHAQSLFECILHTDPEAQNWRSNATAILVKDYYIEEKDLLAAPQLRVIGKQGVGLDKIDVEACAKYNVKICNTPGVNAGAVAEMALCLAFSVARSVPQLVIRQRIEGESVRKETVSGLLLSKKTVGVVGMGNIGQAVARMFSAGLGARIVAYDPYWPEQSSAEGG
jgi:phosphoglycerate dehydrogenase-like enzyme